MDYKQYIQNKLESHPVGRTAEELLERLPDGGSVAELETALAELDEKGRIAQIGEKWRWMRFE